MWLVTFLAPAFKWPSVKGTKSSMSFGAVVCGHCKSLSAVHYAVQSLLSMKHSGLFL